MDQPNVIRGSLEGGGLRLAVICARFNAPVTDRLLQGALRGLEESGVARGDVRFFSVPGCVEIPVVAAKLIMDFQKEHKTLTVKAGLLDGERVGPAEVKRLASLPSHDQMLGQVAGLMQGPLQGFVGALGALLFEFAGAVDALRTQRAGAEPLA